jgi:hypothetical protein
MTKELTGIKKSRPESTQTYKGIDWLFYVTFWVLEDLLPCLYPELKLFIVKTQ